MAVEGYVGWHGDGKTYNAVLRVLTLMEELHAAAAKQGRPAPQLWSNATIVGARRFDTWDEMNELLEQAVAERLRVVLLVDEAGKWLSARFFNKLDPRVLTVLQERRKVGAGLDWFWTAPHYEHVDRLLRDVTQLVHVCRRIGGSEYSHDGGKPPRVFRVRSFDPVQVTKVKGKPKDRRWVPFSRDVAGLYTTGLVNMGKPMDAELAKRPDYQAPADRGDDGKRVDLGVTIDVRGAKRKR